MYAQPIQRLIAEMAKLPGIGQRTAQRLAFHVLRASDDDALALADAIREVKAKVGLCEVCFNLAEGPQVQHLRGHAARHGCHLRGRGAPGRDPVERTHEFRGLYHVLGGALSPIDGIDPSDLKISELVRRVEAGGVTEVVLATNPTTTGEATATHIAELLRDKAQVTRLASGLPVGADLEHADEVTLGRAFSGRRTV